MRKKQNRKKKRKKKEKKIEEKGYLNRFGGSTRIVQTEFLVFTRRGQHLSPVASVPRNGIHDVSVASE